MTDQKNNLIIVPVPALVAVLLNLEKREGRPLTEPEVVAALPCLARRMPKLSRRADTTTSIRTTHGSNGAWFPRCFRPTSFGSPDMAMGMEQDYLALTSSTCQRWILLHPAFGHGA